jgi:hypothetical protein
VDTRGGPPIYAQLNRALRAAVAGGRLPLGDQLPNVRPRTQRKYLLAHRGGVMFTIENPDRQAMWIRFMLAILGAVLTSVGWWRWAS